MNKKCFGDERLDTKDDIYYMRFNKTDDLVFYCDPKDVDIVKKEKQYSVAIKGKGFNFKEKIHIKQLELLNNNYEVVGLRALPYAIIVLPGDTLNINYTMSVVVVGSDVIINT